MKRSEITRTVLTDGTYYYKARGVAGAYFTKDVTQAMFFDDEIYSSRNEHDNFLQFELEQFSVAFETNTFDDDFHPIKLDISSFKLKKVHSIRYDVLRNINVENEAGIIRNFSSSFWGIPYSFKKIFGKVRIWMVALICAIVMSSADIFMSNLPVSLGNDLSVITLIERYITKLADDTENEEDVYFVNVGYDKELANYKITETESGKVAITDREKLLKFLAIAEKAKYKYLFLDIRFEKDIITKWDKQLFEQIRRMKNILYACHVDEKGEISKNVFLTDSNHIPKYAFNDYWITIFNFNFTRYQYIQDSRKSVALRMYEDMSGKKMTKKEFLYFNDGALCKNCPFIPIKKGINGHEGDGSSSSYLDMGSFLLSMPEEIIIEDMKDKIVVVGDFQNDLHDTYMGSLPGPFLTYLAYKYIDEGKNKVSVPLLLVLTLVFFVLVMLKINYEPMPWLNRWLERFPLVGRLQASRFWTFCQSFGWHTVILSIGCYVLYVLFGLIYNILIPSFILGIIDVIKINRLSK